MLPFVDRLSERKRLELALARPEGQLIVLYGRRRCGKSRLLQEVLSGSDCYYLADQREASLQREALSAMLEPLLPGFSQAQYPDWVALLDTLHHRATAPFTLCLDEFPYLVKSDPALPSVIQGWVDRHRERKVHLVLCGSAQHMMEDITLHRQAPLYGRADELMRIRPLAPYWLREVLGLDAVATVEEFAVWGGMPRYWELRQRYADLRDAILNLSLDPNGVLYEEPMRILLDEQRSAVQPLSILSLVANGVHRLSEIGARLEKPASQLSRPVQFLLDINMLRREVPFGASSRTGKRSLYFLDDPYLHFYSVFVQPHKSWLEQGNTALASQRLDSGLAAYTGLWWERLVRLALPGIAVEGIHFSEASRFWGTIARGQDVELDAVAKGSDGKTILICEAKWTGNPDRGAIYRKLKEAADLLPFTKGKKVLLGLASKSPQPHSPFDLELGPDEVVEALR